MPRAPRRCQTHLQSFRLMEITKKSYLKYIVGIRSVDFSRRIQSPSISEMYNLSDPAKVRGEFWWFFDRNRDHDREPYF